MSNKKIKVHNPKKNNLKSHGCILKMLNEEEHGKGIIVQAARTAIEINPMNRPILESTLFSLAMVGIFTNNNVSSTQNNINDNNNQVDVPSHLAVLTTKYWGNKGVNLSVGFMESIQNDLRDKILSYMNIWSKYGNAKFQYTQNVSNADVRITRDRRTGQGGGYWSYLGTDIKSINPNQPTMCLQDFTMKIRESEFLRVIPHETGHTLGFPHEHLRSDIIKLLDRNKTINYFQRFQGWPPNTTIQQVLTPLEERSLIGTPADQRSIMCYMLAGECTISGQPIVGGEDLSESDKKLFGELYPLDNVIINPPPPPSSETYTITITGKDVKIKVNQ